MTNSNISYIGNSPTETKLRINIYGDIKLNKDFLNYLDYDSVEKELTKLPKKVKKALVKNKITIEINDNAVLQLGPTVEGFYNYNDRRIVIKHNEDSIKYALLMIDRKDR